MSKQESSSGIKRTPRNSGLLCFFLIVVLMQVKCAYDFTRRKTTIAESPDGKWEIAVVERGTRWIDRNFKVILQDTKTRREREIFRSWDQRASNEIEEFVWSADSQRVALVGDRYWVIDDSQLPSGKTVFLVYDLENDTVYCNTDHGRDFEPMTGTEAVDFIGKEM